MPRSKEVSVKIEGADKLSRDFRRFEREAEQEIDDAAERGAETSARVAALLAPRRTGALAQSYRADARSVRSSLPYAGVIEFGGTISPRGTPILIKRSAPVTRAVERETNAIVHDMGEGIERAALRTGWHR